MSLAEKLLRDFEELSDDRKIQVLDFVEFLKDKRQQELAAMMDEIIAENKQALTELAK